MKSLVVKRTVNLSELERALVAIGSGEGIELRLPNSLRDVGPLGIEAYLIQLVLTWIRSGENKKVLHTYLGAQQPASNFSTLCEHVYGICALSMADTILSVDRQNIPRRLALGPAIERMERTRRRDFKSAFKGMYVALPCIKGASGGGELDSPLYNGADVVAIDQFRRIVREALFATLPSKVLQSTVDENYLDPIAEIVRELFTNTHNHARHDEKGNQLLKNLRCVIFRQQKVSKKTFENWLQAGGGSKVKFGARKKFFETDGGASVLEIAIIDGGPGFAGRWTGKAEGALDLEEERLAVLECFKKHRSTQSHPSAGSGLSNVQRALARAGGWFRLRTGRVEIEKGYLDESGDIEIRASDVKAREAGAAGAAFNFTIPLRVQR